MRWQSLIVRGLVALAFGVVVMAWPQPSLGALAVIWGMWAWAEGIITIHQAVVGATSSRLLQGAIGCSSMVAGAMAFASPGFAAAALTWVLGVWLVGRGVLDAVPALRRSPDGVSGTLVLGAAVSVTLGVLFITHPGRAALNITWLLGLVTAVWGAVTVVLALLARRGGPAPDGRRSRDGERGRAVADRPGPAGAEPG